MSEEFWEDQPYQIDKPNFESEYRPSKIQSGQLKFDFLYPTATQDKPISELLDDFLKKHATDPPASQSQVSLPPAIVLTKREAVEMLSAWSVFEQTMAMTKSRKRTQWLMLNVLSVMPRKHRQSIQCDLHDDVKEYREAGWSERRIRFHISSQVAIVIFQRVKSFLFIATGLTAIYAKFRALF